tara:strand:- start:357 stop:626 length:270 start_codon:yes stop_codon:yes gene_type:complete
MGEVARRHGCLRVVAALEAERRCTWAACGFAPDGTVIAEGADDADVEGMRKLLEKEAAAAEARWLDDANANAIKLQRAWRRRAKPYYVI